MRAIIKREFNAYFSSPAGYVFLAVFVLLSSLFFVQSCLASGSSNMTNYFASISNFNLFLIPILTMKLMSDEKKQKTDQLLLTAPITLSGIILGKFIAAFIVYAIGVSATLIYAFILSFYTDPAFGIIFGNIIGMLLIGAVLIAAGLFMSSLTESQIISAITSFAMVLLFFTMASISASVTVPFISTVLNWLSIFTRYTDFANGLFNFSSLIYYISLTAFFIFLSVRVLEKRRWN